MTTGPASPSSSKPELSEDAIQWLFKALNRIYDGGFTARFKSEQDALEAKRFWQRMLGGYAKPVLLDALRRCVLEHPTYPPKPGEFLKLCQGQQADYLAAFNEARDNAVARMCHQDATWSHPAIYWAAVRFGYSDLAASRWSQAQARWKKHLGAELAKGDAIEAVPPHREALPAPGRTATTMAEGRKRLATILARQRAVTTTGEQKHETERI